jgi:hypothetical protein
MHARFVQKYLHTPPYYYLIDKTCGYTQIATIEIQCIVGIGYGC